MGFSLITITAVKLGVLSDSGLGWGGTPISRIGGGCISRSLSRSGCLSSKIVSNLGLFSLLAKLKVKIGIYCIKKHKTILSLRAITNHVPFLPRMSPVALSIPHRNKERNILHCPLTKKMHHEDFLFPPAFDPNVRLLLCFNSGSFHEFL